MSYIASLEPHVERYLSFHLDKILLILVGTKLGKCKQGKVTVIVLVIAGLELPPLVTYKLARLKDENGGEWSGNEDDEGNNLGKGPLFFLGGSFPT